MSHPVDFSAPTLQCQLKGSLDNLPFDAGHNEFESREQISAYFHYLSDTGILKREIVEPIVNAAFDCLKERGFIQKLGTKIEIEMPYSNEAPCIDELVKMIPLIGRIIKIIEKFQNPTIYCNSVDDAKKFLENYYIKGLVRRAFEGVYHPEELDHAEAALE